jgi:hypothetical protein
MHPLLENAVPTILRKPRDSKLLISINRKQRIEKFNNKNQLLIRHPRFPEIIMSRGQRQSRIVKRLSGVLVKYGRDVFLWGAAGAVEPIRAANGAAMQID